MEKGDQLVNLNKTVAEYEQKHLSDLKSQQEQMQQQQNAGNQKGKQQTKNK